MNYVATIMAFVALAVSFAWLHRDEGFDEYVDEALELAFETRTVWRVACDTCGWESTVPLTESEANRNAHLHDRLHRCI